MAWPTRSLRAATGSLLIFVAQLTAPPAQAQREAESLSASFRSAAERVLPSVVAVRPLGMAGSGLARVPFPGPRIPEVLGPVMPGALPPAHGGHPGGSGLVIDAQRGLILTTRQATLGTPRVGVGFTDGREIEAGRVVYDPQSELVLLSVETQGLRLKEAEWGSAEGLKIGDWVLAVGRPSGRTHAVSAGIVSGRGAGGSGGVPDDAIRTDAVVDDVNAGGPLIDLEGKVVGINGGGPRLAPRSYSFAMPAERARRIEQDLAGFGRVRRGYLGLTITPELPATPDPANRAAGLLVTSVMPGGPAAEAGFQPGDRILRLDGEPITELDALSRAVEEAPVGREFRISIDRSGKQQELTVRTRPRPTSAGGPPALGPGASRLAPRGRPRGPARAGAGSAGSRPGGPVIRSEVPGEEPAPSAEPEPPRPSGKPRTAPKPAAPPGPKPAPAPAPTVQPDLSPPLENDESPSTPPRKPPTR